VCQW
jgi:hypothetical protein